MYLFLILFNQQAILYSIYLHFAIVIFPLDISELFATIAIRR